MKAESRQIPQKLAARLKFVLLYIHILFILKYLYISVSIIIKNHTFIVLKP